MREIVNFVWDFDGTLYDTYPVIIENLRKALQDFGFDCDPVDAMSRLLENIASTRDYYADFFGIDREKLMDTYMGYRQQAIALLEAKPIAGVREVLEHICAAGKKNYIFTNRRCDETEEYLRKHDFEKYFEDIAGQDTPGFVWKPDPAGLKYLIEKHNLDISKTVMIGDRHCDLESGRAAGTKTAHIVCAIAPETLECDWRVESYRQMLELL